MSRAPASYSAVASMSRPPAARRRALPSAVHVLAPVSHVLAQLQPSARQHSCCVALVDGVLCPCPDLLIASRPPPGGVLCPCPDLLTSSLRSPVSRRRPARRRALPSAAHMHARASHALVQLQPGPRSVVCAVALARASTRPLSPSARSPCPAVVVLAVPQRLSPRPDCSYTLVHVREQPGRTRGACAGNDVKSSLTHAPPRPTARRTRDAADTRGCASCVTRAARAAHRSS